ncbi:MAG: hypothetical protein JWM19_5079 [Actinomycetia bacterium]|nr:hypothetical protein [Actinomycetes bacterium]
MKRWMVVAALGLAAVGGIVTPGAARASSSSWYQVYQSGFAGGFDQVAAISKSNIWAVGDISKAGKTVYQPFIRHFNGRSWQAVTIPDSAGSTSSWVSASASNNVWVGGLKNGPVATSVVYRWNGARWGKVPLPAMTAVGDVVALAPNNVWALAYSGTVPDDIFHWNGSRWQYYLPDTINFIPQGISASAANNVWVSGYSYSGRKQEAAAYRWNGSAWHAVSMPHPVVYDGPTVSAVSPSNVWIGYDASSTRSYALHWDGHQWHTVTPSYYASVYDIVPDGKGGYWFGPQAILTGSKWTNEQLPEFTGGNGPGVVRIPGTTSFLLNAAVATGNPSTEKPTIFQFNL